MTDLRIARDLALPLDVAGEATAILATRGAGKSYASAVLVEELHAAGVQVLVLDPTGVYWGLRSSASGKSGGLPLFVLGGAHGDVELAPTAGGLIADVVVDTGQSMVLDLSDFDTKGAQTRFVAGLIERLYHRKARARTTLHVVVDEANEFAPQRPMRDEPRMLGAMERLVGKGRSRGIGVTLVSQRSAAINKNVLDLVDTLVAMRTLGPRDRKAIADWVEVKQADGGVVESLPSLPTGTAWVWSPVRQILQRAEIRRIRTFDSYATPRPGETRVEPTATAPLDVAKLGEEIAATAERAKADDPAALKARIRALEQGVNAAHIVSKPEVRIERVPYISPAMSAAMAKIGKANAAVWDDLGRMQDAVRELGEAAAVVDADGSTIPPRRALPGGETGGRRTAAAAARASEDDGDLKAKKPREGTPAHLGAREPWPGPDTGQPLGRGERAILTALAQFPGGRSRRQLAFLSGYRVKGGRFGNLLGTLRSAGLVEGNNASLRATPAGLAAVPDVEPVPTGRGMLDHWLGRLGAGERAIMEVVVGAYPDALPRAEVAQRAGYEPGGGRYGNLLGTLRTAELIEGTTELRASDDLFS